MTTERQTILRGCLHARLRMKIALHFARCNYDTPVGRKLAIEEAEVELWRWQMRAARYRRSTAEERNRHAVEAWRSALGMDGWDNIAAAE